MILSKHDSVWSICGEEQDREKACGAGVFKSEPRAGAGRTCWRMSSHFSVIPHRSESWPRYFDSFSLLQKRRRRLSVARRTPMDAASCAEWASPDVCLALREPFVKLVRALGGILHGQRT